MTTSTDSDVAFYTTHGLITDPGAHAGLLDDLPRAIGGLAETVQGVMMHVFWAERYGPPLSEERTSQVNLRTVARQLAAIRALDPRPLTAARPPELKLIGNCRDHSALLAAMLRHQGVPARARCGFATYFLPDHYEDHWVCEYWRADEGRWALCDAQLDALQREVLRVDFDTLDVPRDRFITGGAAWQMCRAGQANPDAFGIFDMHGLWFVRGNAVRDLLALAKVELLPWDHWGIISKRDDEMTADDTALVDRIADATCADDPADAWALAALPGVRPPEGWAP